MGDPGLVELNHLKIFVLDDQLSIIENPIHKTANCSLNQTVS